MKTNPKYTVGDSVYLKESAALGFLEAVLISGVHLGQNGWMYSIDVNIQRPAPIAQYGDRKSLVNTATLFFSEEEFVELCDALTLAEVNAQLALNRLKAQRQALCPTGTSG